MSSAIISDIFIVNGATLCMNGDSPVILEDDEEIKLIHVGGYMLPYMEVEFQRRGLLTNWSDIIYTMPLYQLKQCCKPLTEEEN